MAKSINIPKSALASADERDLSPSARRIYVTGWAICDDTGTMRQEQIDLAVAAWGADINRPDRLSVAEILFDMERLGFCRGVSDRGEVFRFQRCATWLARISAGSA